MNGYQPEKSEITTPPDVGSSVQNERRIGKWIKNQYNGFLCCEFCRDCFIIEEWIEDGKWNYCPNCGARLFVYEKEEVCT